MDFDLITRVVRLVEEADISELEVESDEEGIRVVVKKGGTAPVMPYPIPAFYPAPATQQPAPAAEPTRKDALEENMALIRSPMVGSFYRSPAPDALPFVEVGTEVKPDTIVCILEAMKVMNEIKAGLSGIVREILVENAQPVEFDQPLFKLEKR